MIKDSFLYFDATLFFKFFEDENFYAISTENYLDFDFNWLSRQKTLAILAAKIYLREEMQY